MPEPEIRVQVLDSVENAWRESADDFSAIREGDIFRSLVNGTPGLIFVADADAEVARLDDVTGKPVYRVSVKPIRIRF